MKKRLLKSMVLAIAGVGLFAGSAMAIPSEWGVINPTDLTGTALNSAGFDVGYYISSDATRTNWSIRWEDDANLAGNTIFTGSIELENNLGVFAAFSFEGGDLFFSTPQSATYFSIIANGIDGINFSISQIADPSYVGFDLNMNGFAMDPSKIYLGAIAQTVASLGQDEDFAIKAPVPEPTTMLLFGTGLAGLAGIARRRKK